MARVFRISLMVLCVWVDSSRADGFSDFLIRLLQLPQDQRQPLVDSLFNHLPEGAPLSGEGGAWFLHNGNPASVAVAGDMTGWEPDLALSRIAGTTLWERFFACEADARLDYKLVLGGSQWILDPLNPHTCPGGFGPNSELAMPAYMQPEEVLDHGWPDGTLVTWEDFSSPQLGNTRDIRILLPPGHQADLPRPVCLVHDGQEFLSIASLRNVVAWLAHQHPGLELPIFVCVPPVNRLQEYHTSQQDLFARFLTETVVPAVRAQWATYDDPARWITLGASDGANISTWLLGHYPGHFGKGVLLSPYVPTANRQALAARPADSLRVYLNWGRYDLEDVVQTAQATDSLLSAMGAPHLARLYNEGHSWGLWRATVDEGLLFVLEEESSLPEPTARPRWGLEAHPNPFNPLTRIPFTLNRPEQVKLSVHNLLGQEVAVLVDGLRMAGQQEVVWEATSLASGRYLVTLEVDGRRESLPVTLLR